jgi:hypothetical protein
MQHSTSSNIQSNNRQDQSRLTSICRLQRSRGITLVESGGGFCGAFRKGRASAAVEDPAVADDDEDDGTAGAVADAGVGAVGPVTAQCF